MDKEIAISVKNVSKTFRISCLGGRQAHEKVSSIKGAVTSWELASIRNFRAEIMYI